MREERVCGEIVRTAERGSGELVEEGVREFM